MIKFLFILIIIGLVINAIIKIIKVISNNKKKVLELELELEKEKDKNKNKIKTS